MKGKLVFFSGKMGAGKTTYSMKMAASLSAVWLSEDEWLAALYPQAIKSIQDYVLYSNRLKPQIKKLVQNILNSGTDVVMDFPGNTVSQRQWFKELFTEISAPHELVYIDVEDDICLNRIAQRRVDQPERAATDTPEMFEKITAYFEAPDLAEGFDITRPAQA